MAKLGRKPIPPGAVYGPFTVTGPEVGRDQSGRPLYPCRCGGCGREYRRTAASLSSNRPKRIVGCRACSAPLRDRPGSAARTAAILDARRAGATLGELAAAFGVTRQRIHQILRRAGACPSRPST